MKKLIVIFVILCLGSLGKEVIFSNPVIIGKYNLPKVNSFSWSPDGRYIAYGQNDEEKIYILNIKTGKKKYIIDGLYPKWLSNSEIITNKLEKVNINTSKKRLLLKESIEISRMYVSPDNSNIVYIGHCGNKDRQLYDVIILLELNKQVYKESIIYIYKPITPGYNKIIGWINNDEILINTGENKKIVNINKAIKMDITNKAPLYFVSDKFHLDIKTKLKKDKYNKENFINDNPRLSKCARNIKGDIFSYDGKYILVVEQNELAIVNIRTGKKIYSIPDTIIYGKKLVKWSPVNYKLAYLTDNTLIIKDLSYLR
ncbi:MAG: hypothetical protein ACOCRK_07615 [bacterium]